MNNPKILVTGASGMVGHALMIHLDHKYGKSLNCDSPTSDELDLRNQDEVTDYLMKGQYDQIYHCAGTVGGIGYNAKYPGQMIYNNLMMQTNILESARHSRVPKVLIIGSSCIYPKDKEILTEADLMAGSLEGTNRAYAIAKIAGLEMVNAYNREYGTDFRAVMPCNMYGPGDTYDELKSHVIPAMIMRFHRAAMEREPSVVIWGSGNPLREFLYSGDFAVALHRVMNISKEGYQSLAQHGFINVGSGEEVSISRLGIMVKNMTGYTGSVFYNNSHPDGTYRKLLDSKLICSLGWAPAINLEMGLRQVYEEYKKLYQLTKSRKR
jgi:GDP-L-fucose synthase